MALTFFNPASLLPNPDVAVNKPPESNTGAFVAASLMQSIRDNLKKKQEVDTLRQNTNDIADYVQDKSPGLANMLRARTQQYQPTAFNGYDGIDVKSEQSSLLNGVIKLRELEANDEKLAASGNAVKFENNYKYKLTAAEQAVNNENNNWNTWENNENRRMDQANDDRNKMAQAGVSALPPRPVRGVNPYTDSRNAAQETFKGLLGAGPGDIQGMSTVNSRKSTNRGIIDPAAPLQSIPANEADLPQGGSNTQSNDLVGTGLSPELQSTDNPENPIAPPQAIPIPELPADNRTVSEVPADKGVIEVKPTVPAAAPPTLDPAEAINQKSLERKAANVKAANTTIDTITSALKREAGSYLSKENVDSAISRGNEIKEEISSLPDPGSTDWNNQVRSILSAYKTSVTMLQRNTVASEKKEAQVANAEQLQYYVKDSADKAPITVYKESIDGMPRYFILKDGKREEVTNKIGNTFLPLATNTSPTNVTAPGVKIPSVLDILNKGSKK